jgi:nucleoside-diphosphate-sugar epimerase
MRTYSTRKRILVTGGAGFLGVAMRYSNGER